MKEAQGVCIVTEHLLLRPYMRAHVPTYHRWMQDPYLLDMTATEPMSADEVEASRQDWLADPEKLCFIMFERAVAEATEPAQQQATASCTSTAGMVGDVGIFLLPPGEDGGEDGEGAGKAAEVMVMMAEPAYRRRGWAREAVLAIMAYAVRRLGVTRFTAKISSANAPSLALFQSKLGFTHHKDVPAFEEVHVRRRVVAPAESGGAEAAAAGPPVPDHPHSPGPLVPVPGEEPAFTAEVEAIGVRVEAIQNPDAAV